MQRGVAIKAAEFEPRTGVHTKGYPACSFTPASFRKVGAWNMATTMVLTLATLAVVITSVMSTLTGLPVVAALTMVPSNANTSTHGPPPLLTTHFVNAETPVLPPQYHNNTAPDESVCMNPNIIKVGDEWRLFYAGADGNGKHRILLATAPVEGVCLGTLCFTLGIPLFPAHFVPLTPRSLDNQEW